MAEGIYQLTFVATHRPPVPRLTGAQSLNRAIEYARTFDALQVTGIMLARTNRLLLCMEGDEATVAAEYARLKAQPEAEGVTILRQRHREERAFSRWGFAFEGDPRDNMPITLADRLVAVLGDAPPEIRQTFLAFVRLDMPPSLH